MIRPFRALAPLLLLTLATPLSARDSLGVFGQWAAFRDAEVPRCYAIAAANGDGSAGFATVAAWPDRQVRGQVHFRLSRSVDPEARIALVVGGESFVLTAAARNAWASDGAGDSAIIAAMRAATTMQVRGRDRAGRAFSDSYPLDGAATAIDAAVVGCAQG
ncbi:MAG: invasion associated locus B family protein [Alteraurantiacibacter sp.]